MKTSLLRNLWPLAAMCFVSSIAVGATYYWCQQEQMCGQASPPTIATGCMGVTCPYANVCQGEVAQTGNNCSQSYYMAQCHSVYYPVTETGGCNVTAQPVPGGNEPGGTACTACSIN